MALNKMLIEMCKWGGALLFSLTIAILINMFVVQPYTVSGQSMEPLLEGLDPYDESQIGDRVVVFKSAYVLGSKPKYGDIVIIDSRVNRQKTIKDDFLESSIVAGLTRSNKQEGNNWIKRVVGEPGDQLKVSDGKLYRNGEVVIEDYVKEKMDHDFEAFIVPENTIFVMGDNRNNSGDSREIGPIPIENVIGKATFRFYPFSKISRL